MMRSTTFWRWLGLLLVNGMLLAALTASTLRPSLNDAWRRADAARQAGNLRQATGEYQRLLAAGERSPALLLQLAELRMLRGEWGAATSVLGKLASQPLLPAEADRLALAQGWIAVQSGDVAAATTAWERVSAQRQGQANVLRAELALRSGDIVSATERLNLVGDLAEPWRSQAYYRAAQLNLANAPETTTQLLDLLALPGGSVALPALDPARLTTGSAALRATASLADPNARRIGLARQWADEGLSRAARRVFAEIPDHTLYAPLARNEAAKLRWLSGDPPGALADITQATLDYPNVAELRRTQLTIAVASGDLATAQAALLDAVRADGRSADNYVASAVLELANQDYNAAAAAYDAAIQTAVVTGSYQLQAANFYVAVPLRVCSTGRSYAEQAIGSSVDEAARRLSAQLALRCNDPTAAISITESLLSQLPDDPQLLYLRGAARWQLGQRAAAAVDLEAAANQAPGSRWMREAERLIGQP